jgi:hypothetical protein
MMRKTKTIRYDVAEHLRSPEEMAAYLEACLDEAKGDAAFIAKALDDIARARGMGQVARDAGLRSAEPPWVARDRTGDSHGSRRHQNRGVRSRNVCEHGVELPFVPHLVFRAVQP